MESYEVEIRGKVFPVKAVRGLTGHDIKHYRIHGEKQIPFVKNSDQTKMEAGEIFAIETFGTTGRGYIRDDVRNAQTSQPRSKLLIIVKQPGMGIYGYGLDYNAPARVSLPLASANRLYKTIKENFGTIVFCRRYLERLGCERYLAGVCYSFSSSPNGQDIILTMPTAQLSCVTWVTRRSPAFGRYSWILFRSI